MAGEIIDGLPLISPVVGLISNPVGRVGSILHVSICPPLIVGLAVCIAVPLVKVNGSSLYESRYGGISLTWIVIVVEPLPPAFVAVIV